MDFQAKVIQFLGETAGTSRAGNPWKKKEWLVETFGQYPKKIKVQCFGEKSDSMNLEPGKDYTLYVDLESREYQGRWYTDVSVYRVDEYMAQPGGNMAQPQSSQPIQPNFGGAPYGNNAGYPGPDFSNSSAGESDEDLPF